MAPEFLNMDKIFKALILLVCGTSFHVVRGVYAEDANEFKVSSTETEQAHIDESETLINQLADPQDARVAYHNLHDFKHLDALKNHLSDSRTSEFDPYSLLALLYVKDAPRPSIGATCLFIIAGLMEGYDVPNSLSYFDYGGNKEEMLDFLRAHPSDSLPSFQLAAAKYIVTKAVEKKYPGGYINFWKRRIRGLEKELRILDR